MNSLHQQGIGMGEKDLNYIYSFSEQPVPYSKFVKPTLRVFQVLWVAL